ncbi:MAG: pyruvate kinase [Oscillospiraceae bacterium]|jgi:pyruvate kinase|nr:pyruvate kinase [Oscillospiraceae bacterium]
MKGMKKLRKTKIVCTLGPATDNIKVLKSLAANGMNVARINMSHQNYNLQKIRVDKLKQVRKELNLPIALLLDTKGPEIRIGKFQQEEKIFLSQGQTFTFVTEKVVGNKDICSISLKKIPESIKQGCKILIDDGLIELEVEKAFENKMICKVLNNGIISSNKSVNIPSTTLSLPFISLKDEEDIKFAIRENFDFIAASFTRSKEDVDTLRKEIDDDSIKIIAKIENHEGLKNIDEIIDASDGIMIARGDLGVEVPFEEIPIIQKKIIKKVYNKGKCVITATQMLDSMIKNPRPTRAETTDVANAIYEGTSAIMLSGESAIGSYPVGSVKTMAKIAKKTEEDVDYVEEFSKRKSSGSRDVTSAVSRAACTTAHDLKAAAIVTITKSGRTARLISKYRPNCPIIACTSSKKVLRQLNLAWGVIPFLVNFDEEINFNDTDFFNRIGRLLKDKKILKEKDIAVFTAGVPLGEANKTNLIKVHNI